MTKRADVLSDFDHDLSADERRRRLVELVRVFGRLGATAFGGPAAHVAIMHDEVVTRRGWLSPQGFLDLLGATHLIPGPNSTEMAIHIGYRRAGRPGLIVAGASFILPAAVMVAALAALYVHLGTRPDARAVLHGIAPVIVAIVAVALTRLAATAVRSWRAWGIAVLSVTALAAGVNELVVLAGGLGLGMLLCRKPPVAPVHSGPPQPPVSDSPARGLGGWFASPLVLAASGAGMSLGGIFAVFVKAGAVLFGSGYVLFALLRADLVSRLGWLTEQQLLDAIAVGQITPGPLFTTATFIGYLLGGAPGAIVATAGIFLPAFVYVAISGPLVPRLRQSRAAGAALDGVNAASMALMAVVTWQLGRAAVVDPVSVVLAALTLGLVLRWRVNSTWLILGGAVVGFAVGS